MMKAKTKITFAIDLSYKCRVIEHKDQISSTSKTGDREQKQRSVYKESSVRGRRCEDQCDNMK